MIGPPVWRGNTGFHLQPSVPHRLCLSFRRRCHFRGNNSLGGSSLQSRYLRWQAIGLFGMTGWPKTGLVPSRPGTSCSYYLEDAMRFYRNLGLTLETGWGWRRWIESIACWVKCQRAPKSEPRRWKLPRSVQTGTSHSLSDFRTSRCEQGKLQGKFVPSTAPPAFRGERTLSTYSRTSGYTMVDPSGGQIDFKVFMEAREAQLDKRSRSGWKRQVRMRRTTITRVC
jgi:hypothetical protein